MPDPATQPVPEGISFNIEIQQTRAYLAATPGPFADDAELLKAAHLLIDLAGATRLEPKDKERSTARTLLPSLRARFYENLRQSATSGSPLAGAILQHELSSLEAELLLAAALSALGARLFNLGGNDVEDLNQILLTLGHDALPISRALQPAAALVKGGLIQVRERDPWPLSRVSLPPSLLDTLCRPEGDQAWEVQSYRKFLERLADVTYQMDALAGAPPEEDSQGEFELPNRLDRLLREARLTLAAHPDWPLTPVAATLNQRELALLIALISKDMGHLPCASEFFTGTGLVTGLGGAKSTYQRLLRLLADSGKLRQNDWIRPGAPATGGGALAQTSEEGLAEASWELTDPAREQFQLPVHKRLLSGGLRNPFTMLRQLVLHEEALTAIQMALAQVRNQRLLFDGWGLAQVIGYGRGTTVLFSGSSGVGKTAAAEAMATELGRPLLEADASRLLSCWVGETEKNLTRLFYEARQTTAVLFFDEADAFFFDRSMAGKSWEISQVNVLLRQLERFEGLCILATNRSDCLDPAFVRRLSLKVDFQPPTPEMAERIWKLLLPDRMPLAVDVDLVTLGRLGLTGGQIKNAVMNAARRTAADGARMVGMEALMAAALAERGVGLGQIGFREEKGSGGPTLRPAA